MNKKKAFELLKENLEKYLEEGFIFHKRFLEELRTLIKDASGQGKEIFALLIKQFSFVKVQGKNFNLRFLMTFDDDANPVFLVAFYERSGKRKTDYSQWKDVLKQIYSEI